MALTNSLNLKRSDNLCSVDRALILCLSCWFLRSIHSILRTAMLWPDCADAQADSEHLLFGYTLNTPLTCHGSFSELAYIRTNVCEQLKLGPTHGAPYRSYGYVPLRFRGGGTSLREWEHNKQLKHRSACSNIQSHQNSSKQTDQLCACANAE